ncbi:LamG domain-containing protein [Spartinivicinus ruber]|uniref:LamG domain-containing protein n=1 Tax=Spartinivicinus ruber TaxID=2683272 RepID=UPI001CA3D3F6|nr:LamG domain-containing protein [Spartinivicinus ruber]
MHKIVKPLTIAISVALSSSAVAQSTTSELGVWSFDGGFSQEGTRDYSDNHHHGYFFAKADLIKPGEALLSGGTYTPDGANGNALKVEQDNPLLINIPGFNSAEPFSLSFWLKQTTTDNVQQVLFEQVNDNGVFTVYLDENNYLHVEWQDGSPSPKGVTSIDPLTNINNQWQHVVFSFNGKLHGMHVALNGKRLPVQLQGKPAGGFTGLISVGNSLVSDLSSPFQGQLDEIQLYNRPLSSIEAKCLAELGFNCVPTIYQGPKGPRGLQGPSGLTGDQGNKGEKGDRGLQGEKGNKGDTGPIGPRGPQGFKGEKGEQGEQGPQGEIGQQGPKGDQGIQGPKGDKGDPGSSVDRKHYYTTKAERGTSIVIPEQDIIDLCSDEDGCQLRIGLEDWSTAYPGAVEYKSTMFFYNKDTKVWVGEGLAGKNGDNLFQANSANFYACYFSDGDYENWSNAGDKDLNFSFVSWKEYVANCRLTIID